MNKFFYKNPNLNPNYTNINPNPERCNFDLHP